MFLTFSSLIFSLLLFDLCALLRKRIPWADIACFTNLVNFYIEKWTAIFKNTLIVALIQAAPEDLEKSNILADNNFKNIYLIDNKIYY